MTDADLEIDRLREQLKRERDARTQADYARVLIARGTDPDAAAAMAATLPDRVREFTATGEPVIVLATGKTIAGADGLRALALEERIAADRRAALSPTPDPDTARLKEQKRRLIGYGF